MKDESDIYLSEKHLPLRTIAFVVAFVVAVGAFAAGISALGRKQEGYHVITPLPDETAPLYGSGVSFTCYLRGSSAEIKQATNALRRDYSAALKRAYILLDAEHTYEGYVNLASLNAVPGETLAVDPALAAVLRDAYARTLSGQEAEPAVSLTGSLLEEQRRFGTGYNLFAGPLCAEWNSILMLEEPQPFDPLCDAAETERLARLGAAVSNPAGFSFTVVDEAAGTVRFTVPDTLPALLRELELDAPLLDLNLLHDAYELRLIADTLRAQGYGEGYLTTDSGLTLNLSAQGSGAYCLYGFDGADVTPAATAAVTVGSAFSQFRSFPYGEREYGFYTVEADGHIVARHPYLSSMENPPALLASSCVIDGSGDVVGACHRNILLWRAADRDALALCLQDGTRVVACTLQGDADKLVYANDKGMAVLAAAEEYGWRCCAATGNR